MVDLRVRGLYWFPTSVTPHHSTEEKLGGGHASENVGLHDAGPVISLAFLLVSPHAQNLDQGQQQQ